MISRLSKLNAAGIITVVCSGLTLIASGLFDARAGNNKQGVLTTAITLQRHEDAPVADATGGIKMSYSPTRQIFNAVVKGITSDKVTDGLAIRISHFPMDTNNFFFVNVLDGPGTNGTWRLNLEGTQTAPAQLGVTNILDLVNHFVQVIDVATNIYLTAVIPPFESDLRSLSYKAKAELFRPNPAPSPEATGEIRVKLNAVDGSSVLDVRAKKLSGGNSYCSWVVPVPGLPLTNDCPKTAPLINGRAIFKSDTGKGEPLAIGAIEKGILRVDDYSGYFIEIRDQFGDTHLIGIIP